MNYVYSYVKYASVNDYLTCPPRSPHPPSRQNPLAGGILALYYYYIAGVWAWHYPYQRCKKNKKNLRNESKLKNYINQSISYKINGKYALFTKRITYKSWEI
jgi:hypothetical protein